LTQFLKSINFLIIITIFIFLSTQDFEFIFS
jgi:hypothetical protein